LPAGDPLRLVRLLEIFVLIAAHPPRAHLSAAGAVHAQRPEIARRIQRVVAYVGQNFDGEISHAGAASVARMTPTAFSRFFRHHVGKTFEDYVNEVRIGQVCAELQQTDEPITTIALRCGFQNLANFNRRFRERLGTSPRDYRALHMLSSGTG
jgi:AraC-like DNA-binding protein